MVDQFHSACSRRKLRVKAGKSKVIVLEKKVVEVVNFGNPYSMSVPVNERCEIAMEGEMMEVVKEFTYLGTALSNHGETEGEVRERAVKGRSVIGSITRAMRWKNVSMEVKRD